MIPVIKNLLAALRSFSRNKIMLLISIDKKLIAAVIVVNAISMWIDLMFSPDPIGKIVVLNCLQDKIVFLSFLSKDVFIIKQRFKSDIGVYGLNFFFVDAQSAAFYQTFHFSF